MSEIISESSDRNGQYKQPPVDDSVRCPGCGATRQWASFDEPPADMDAVGTCPDCGTHIIGFDVITEDDREEWAKFHQSLTDSSESNGQVDEEITS